MCLKETATVIEQACNEINSEFLKKRPTTHIQGYSIPREEAEPVIFEVTKRYDLNPDVMFKRLNIQP